MKNNVRSNLDLRDVLNKIILQEVNLEISKNNIETDSVSISDLNDLQKKTDNGIVTGISNGGASIRLDNGQNITIKFDNFVQIVPTINQNVSISYDGDDKPYIINAENGGVDIYGLTTNESIVLISKVLEFDGIDNIKLVTGDPEKTFKSLNGLVLIAELTDKLNKLVGEIDNLKTYIATHTHPTAPTGPVSPPSNPFTGTFSKFNKDDYENNNITQGKYE